MKCRIWWGMEAIIFLAVASTVLTVGYLIHPQVLATPGALGLRRSA